MHFELTKEFISQVIGIIEDKDDSAAIAVMKEMHAADIAELYDELNIEQAKYLFLLLDSEKAADVLAELEDSDRERFMAALPSDVIAKQFIEEMDSDDAADVLADLSDKKKDEVLSHIEDVDQAGDIVDLMNYDEDTAGGLMGKELIAVNINMTVDECIKEVRKLSENVNEIYFLYIVDNDNKLLGIISIKDLILNKRSTKISDIYNKEVIKTTTDTPAEDVANLMDKYDLVSMPVTDSIGRLVGRITIDDVVDVIREEAEKDYQLASGIVDDVESTDTVMVQTKARLPWLLIGMFGGIMGALIIGHFEGDIMKYAGLALFLPMIAAMAGNVGVQSSAIVVQGLASNSMGIEGISKKLFKELLIGLLNGIICSVIVLVYNMITSDSLALTITVSTALFLVIVFASVFGTFIPLLLNKFKIDPAVATGPFITTANDIIGLFMYLTTGSIIFNIL